MSDLKLPYRVNEKAGIKHYCACGKSENMPYCDGSHKGTGIEPHEYEVEVDMPLSICACGKSKNMPLCDGSHQQL